MSHSRRPRLASLLAPLLILGASVLSLLVAASPDDVSTPPDPPQVTPPAQNSEAERLAVYAGINQEYLTIKPIFQKACFDCHSNATVYPWYYGLPGITGLIDHDIEEGRESLDFSEGFPFKGKGELPHLLEELKEEIDHGGMPPWQYRALHWGTSITGKQKDSVFAWIDRSIARLERLEKTH